MEDKILIVMTSGPDTPRRCATPFFFATLAAAMDYEVAMFFTIDGTLLLKKGMAETIYPKAGGKPVSDFLHDAQEATELHDLKPEDLIDGVKMVGGARMWQLSDERKTLTF